VFEAAIAPVRRLWREGAAELLAAGLLLVMARLKAGRGGLTCSGPEKI
jgi:hypothetical protein